MPLNTFIKSKPALNLLKTISFYIIAIAAIFILDNVSPSGPCTPGLGIFLFMLLVPIVICLLGINLFRIFKGDQSLWSSAAVHLGVLLLFFILR